LDLLADAQVRIRHGGADPRLQLELAAAKLGRPALDPGTAALAARIERLERGVGAADAAGAAPAPPAASPRPAAAAAPPQPPPAAATAVAATAPADEGPARETAQPGADVEHLERLW